MFFLCVVMVFVIVMLIVGVYWVARCIWLVLRDMSVVVGCMMVGDLMIRVEYDTNDEVG